MKVQRDIKERKENATGKTYNTPRFLILSYLEIPFEIKNDL